MWLGLTVLVAMYMVQCIIAAIAHRRQSSYVPGKIDPNLGHDSFVFRSHRTAQNSLENSAPFIFLILIGVHVGVDESTLSVCTWLFVAARTLHMLLYYIIATEKNPSPRSYFYTIGLLTTMYLLVVVFIKAI